MIAKIVLWLVIIGGLGVGGYAIVKEKEEADATPVVQQEETPAEQSPVAEQGGKKMAFSAFLKNDKGAYKCTVKSYMSDFDNSATVYIHNGMVRGNFSTIAEGRPFDSSVLIKDGYQYVWSSQMQGGGYKIAVDMATGGTAAAQGTYTWNPDQIGEYDCDPWTADTATFSLPKGVVFTDVATIGR